MKKFMKKALATLLALVMISSAFVCLAAVELNQDAANAHYTTVKDLLHKAYGCVVVANREDLLKDITVIKNNGEVLPF